MTTIRSIRAGGRLSSGVRRWARTCVPAILVAAAIGSDGAAAAPSAGALPPELILEIRVAGIGGVPADAAAVALNVTVTNPSGAGFTTVFPCGAPQPDTSNLNYVIDVDVANAVVSKVGVGGAVCIATSAVIDVIVDVSGYFPAGSPLTPVPNSERILDTRNAVGAPRARVATGGTIEVAVGGVRSTPSDASAAVINVTAVDPSADGFATVYPCSEPRPVASNLNFRAGRTTPNLVVARLGVGGKVCIATSAAADFLADVAAYFPGGATGYTPIANPQRVLDTRNGIGAGLAPARSGVELGFTVAGVAGVPPTASAVVLNITATRASAAGFTTVYPCGTTPPGTSSLNFRATSDVANLVIATIGTGGRVCTRSSSTVDLIADIAGYFEGTAAYVPLAAPARVEDTRSDGALRCNLAVSTMRNGSVSVYDLRTGTSRVVSNPRLKEVFRPNVFYRGNTTALLADCSGFVALVDDGTGAGSDLFRFTLDGQATFVNHTRSSVGSSHFVDVLDDDTIVELTLTGVEDGRTGAALVTFVDSAGQPSHPFGLDSRFEPLGITADGIAAFWVRPTKPDIPSGVTYWDTETGSLLSPLPLPAAQVADTINPPIIGLSSYGSYLATALTGSRVNGLAITVPDGSVISTAADGGGGPGGIGSITALQWIGDGTLLLCADGLVSATYRWDIFAPTPTLIVRDECLAEGG
jgi:hypothetical protein